MSYNAVMPASPPSAAPAPKRPLYVPWLAVPFILLILGSAIFVAMRHLRAVIADEIASKDGYVLFLASNVQIDPEFARDPELRWVAIENKALEAAQLRTNIIAMRLFDSEGQAQMAFPATVRSAPLAAGELAAARALQLSSSFDGAGDLGALFENVGETQPAPLLRVVVPVEFEGALMAAAEFIMDGRNVQAALAALDRSLWRYGLGLFVATGGITVLALGMAFGRLQKSNKLLAQRTESLLRANHELTLSAKTSAVGAITAHLIHDLKSPLFGLQSFVAAKEADASGGESSDWKLALSTTERMQKMINEVVRVLQEEKTTIEYELTVEEMMLLIQSKLQPRAAEFGHRLVLEGGGEWVLSNRDANIVLMILMNLAQNAMQAMAAGGLVRVEAVREGGDQLFEVSDNGPGLPSQVLETLFTPSRSTKTGGTGLGLAISKQLANHAGAELSLKESTPQGTTFRLRLKERTELGAAAA